MHELSLLMAVVDTVEDAARRSGAARVRRVRLRIGELAAVDPDALQFAYAVLAGDRQLFAGSELEVEWVPIRIRCPACGAEGAPRPHSVACGRCGNPQTRVVGGEELDIASVEVERHEQPAGDRAEGPVPQR